MTMRDLSVQIARHSERLEHIERRQNEQDAALLRVHEKLDRIHAELLTVGGGVIVSLVLLVLNLIVDGKIKP